jgi:hypothetical protein
VKPPPLTDQNRFASLEIEEAKEVPSTTDIPSVPCKKQSSNYLMVAFFVKRFIRKLRERKNEKPEKYFVRTLNLQQEIFIKVSLCTLDTHDQIDPRALLDCGVTGLFIDKTFVEKNGLKTCTLPHPLKVFNVDGSPNSMGQITEEVSLSVSHKGHKEIAVFEVTNLGKTNVILGQPWLYKHNPEINWKTGEIKFTRCPEDCNVWINEKKHGS